MRDGSAWKLVRGSLDPTWERDASSVRSWRGLSAADACLLGRWVGVVGARLTRLYSDVPVGPVPVDGSRVVMGEPSALEVGAYALRIDAVVEVDGAWWVVEVKPDAGYVGLGQVLAYGFYAPFTYRELEGCGLAVVTDAVQPAIGPVYAQHGVSVWEVGG